MGGRGSGNTYRWGTKRTADSCRQIDVNQLQREGCLRPGLFMKRHLRAAGLAILPQTGHTLNLEEPEHFNRLVLDFLTAVESDRWPTHAGLSSGGALF